MNKDNDYILTVHDELIANLIKLNFDTPYDKYDGVSNNIRIIESKNTSIGIIGNKDDKYSFSLSNREIIIYLILLSNYILSNNNDLSYISLKQIHNNFRGKKQLRDEMWDTYVKTIESLTNKTIVFNIKNRKVNKKKICNYKEKQQLLYVVKCYSNDNDVGYLYHLGNFGKIIKDSKRYSSIVPKSSYQIKYNQINYLLIMLYLSRLIFINRKQGKKLIKISLKTLCDNIYDYNIKGFNSGKTYTDLFMEYCDKESHQSMLVYDYELLLDDARLRSMFDEDNYLRKIKNGKKKIDNYVNNNRNIKYIRKNLHKVLIDLSNYKQIGRYGLITDSKYPESMEFREINVYSFKFVCLYIYL